MLGEYDSVKQIVFYEIFLLIKKIMSVSSLFIDIFLASISESASLFARELVRGTGELSI